MLEYKDLQSEAPLLVTMGGDADVLPTMGLARLAPLSQKGLRVIGSMLRLTQSNHRHVIVSLRTIQKALICRQFWIVRKLTMTNAEGLSQAWGKPGKSPKGDLYNAGLWGWGQGILNEDVTKHVSRYFYFMTPQNKF
jgi:hypothetical protein